MRVLLTDVKCRKARPAPTGRRYDLWDALMPGLSLRVTDRGQKSWTVVARLGRKPIRVTLGKYPALGVRAARTLAQEKLEDLARGIDPRRVHRAALSVERGIDDYLRSRKWTRLYAASVRSAFNVHVRPAIGAMALAEVARRDVVGLLSAIAEKHPPRAITVRSHLSAFFTWATENELVTANPCVGVRPPAEHRSRDRVYSDPEIRAIWSAAEALGWPYGPFVRFLLVTAQRRGQVRDMRWTEIDEARVIWTAFTKEKRLHPTPLPGLATEILATAPKLGAYVFSSTGERGVTNMSWLAREIRAATDTPRDFRLHDLRRTAATRMAELGVSPWVVDAVLDHASGGVTGVYQRYGYVEEMRHALSLWSDRLRAILAAR